MAPVSTKPRSLVDDESKSMVHAAWRPLLDNDFATPPWVLSAAYSLALHSQGLLMGWWARRRFLAVLNSRCSLCSKPYGVRTQPRAFVSAICSCPGLHPAQCRPCLSTAGQRFCMAPGGRRGLPVVLASMHPSQQGRTDPPHSLVAICSQIRPHAEWTWKIAQTIISDSTTVLLGSKD